MSSRKVFSFKTQLAIGKRGETLFHKRYPELKKLDGRQGDFELPDGRIAELKCDSYIVGETTENFFMERFFDFDNEREGGPWQAMSKGVAVFIYTFINGYEFWFDTKQLVDFLEANITKYEGRMIQNQRFDAFGYLVPIASIRHLAFKIVEPKEVA